MMTRTIKKMNEYDIARPIATVNTAPWSRSFTVELTTTLRRFAEAMAIDADTDWRERRSVGS